MLSWPLAHISTRTPLLSLSSPLCLIELYADCQFLDEFIVPPTHTHTHSTNNFAFLCKRMVSVTLSSWRRPFFGIYAVVNDNVSHNMHAYKTLRCCGTTQCDIVASIVGSNARIVPIVDFVWHENVSVPTGKYICRNYVVTLGSPSFFSCNATLFLVHNVEIKKNPRLSNRDYYIKMAMKKKKSRIFRYPTEIKGVTIITGWKSNILFCRA